MWEERKEKNGVGGRKKNKMNERKTWKIWSRFGRENSGAGLE